MMLMNVADLETRAALALRAAGLRPASIVTKPAARTVAFEMRASADADAAMGALVLAGLAPTRDGRTLRLKAGR